MPLAGNEPCPLVPKVLREKVVLGRILMGPHCSSLSSNVLLVCARMKSFKASMNVGSFVSKTPSN